MTGSHAQTGRPNLVVRMWRGFRRFRRTRPYWGGVFAMLGGMEIFVIPLSSNIKVAVYGGIGGTLGYLLGALIFLMGISFWTLPHLRQLTGIGAILFSLASFVFSNLGGFFLGMLLGIIGGSLGFSWMPTMPKRARGEEPAGPAEGDGGDSGDGEDVGLSVLDERPAGPPQPPPAEGSGGGSRTPTTLAVAIPALALALGLGQLAGTHMTRAYAAAPCATASSSPTPSASASGPAGTTAAAAKTAASPSPSPSPTESGFDWLWWWPFKSNSDSTDAAPAATPTATPTATPSSNPPAQPKAAADPSGSPTTCPTPGGSASPKPSTSASPPAGGVKPRDVPPPTRTVVAGKATTVKSSLVEMYGVDYKGVTTVDLAGNKTRRVLWFQMDRLVLHNFVMTDDESGKTMQWVSDPLTLDGHVNVYTADMKATLLGIPLHFTPDSPPPLVLPIMILGDLVQSQDLTTCDTLSGKPLDNKFLS